MLKIFYSIFHLAVPLWPVTRVCQKRDIEFRGLGHRARETKSQKSRAVKASAVIQASIPEDFIIRPRRRPGQSGPLRLAPSTGHGLDVAGTVDHHKSICLRVNCDQFRGNCPLYRFGARRPQEHCIRARRPKEITRPCSSGFGICCCQDRVQEHIYSIQ